MARFFILLPLLSVCLFLPVLAGAGDTKAKNLDFIYVNANTGEAAGGHTALKMGSTVFHFQFFPQGRFLLVRDSWSHFRYVYNELRNRSIAIGRLPLTPQVYNRLKNHFTGLLIAQQQTLDRLQNAEVQLHLATQLAAGEGSVELPAVGLFDSDRAGNVDMLNLHQVVLQQLGENFFVDMQGRIGQRLANLADEGAEISQLSWAARLQELLLERQFFLIMEQGDSLAPDGVIAAPAGAPDLTHEERKFLEEYRKKLAASVIALLQSSRPDRAEPLMLQVARYLAVSRSLATGSLLTLDPFSRRAVPVSVEQGDDLQGLYGQLKQDAVRARADFFREAVYPDIAYAILETSQGRLHEVTGAIRAGSPVRVEQGILLPARSGKVSLAGLPFERPDLQAMVVEEEAGITEFRQQVGRQYGYDLIRRNCATELVRMVNSAFPDSETGRREMGGWLEPDSELVFIPNQFFTLVKERFPVQEEELLPSRRLRQLEALYESGDDLSVWLRESNSLSSTLYVPRAGDTPFLFFTDAAPVLRPFFGITNFCWAAVNSVGGLFTLPMDGGDRFHQGLRGMFYSLPELVFSNIRKGTYGFAETIPSGP